MCCRLAHYITIVLLLFCINNSNAQETISQVQPKDSSQTLSPDYLPVNYAQIGQHHFYPLDFKPIDTNMVEVNHYSKTLRSENIYQSLGIFGQAHQSMVFNFNKEMGFTFIQFPFPLYFKSQNNLQLFDLETSYTKIGYFNGLTGENSLTLTFAQKIQDFTVSINMLANSNTGYFVNQFIQGLVGDAMVRYETPNKKYGFRASYIINRKENQENSGIANVEEFKEHTLEGGYSAYAVNSSNATLKILTHDINFQQYFNISDAKGNYFGTFTHNSQYQRLKSSYFDFLDTSLLRQLYTFESDSTFDTLSCYKIVNSIQWSNFSPNSIKSNANNFFKLAGGIMHEYFEDRETYFNFHSFTPFVRGHIRLLKFLDIQGNFSYSFGGYTHNDAIANLKGEWALKRELNLIVGVIADFYRVAPNYNYSYFHSNHFQWDVSWQKQNIAEFGAYLTFKKFKASANLFLLDNYLIFGSDYYPVQLQEFSRVVQFNIYAPFRYKGFGVTANLSLQNGSSDSIQVPLFAAKSSIFYIFDIFKKKLKLQLGVDVMFNTSYFANGYSPALYSFYFQDQQQVGNFWYVDANATIRISRLYFFARIGNVFSPFQNYNMFTTPNYPMKDFLISLGINWRFHD
jgi:hypothetical protein